MTIRSSVVVPTPASAVFDDPLYARIAAMIYREAGIVLGPEKVSMMKARLLKRLSVTGAEDLSDYVRGVDTGQFQGEMDHLVSALTTNFTHFFREAHHFSFLRETVFPDARTKARNLRIWSAGCSSGQEPYSIAMTGRQAGVRMSITATDIDRAILDRAQRGVFSEADVANIPEETLSLDFHRRAEGFEVGRTLRDMISFEQMNLHGRWQFKQPFDVIFCRNVIIYFDAQSQTRLWEKFRDQLRPGGWLLIGHSERVPDHLRDRLKPIGHTIYQYLGD